MKVLICLAEPFMPQQSGGAQVSTLQLLSALNRRGIKSVAAAEVRRRSAFGLASAGRMLIKQKRFDKSQFQTFTIYRAHRMARDIGAIIADSEPDVVLLQAMNAMATAHAIQTTKTPLVVYWRDAEVARMNGTPKGLSCRFVANSSFTADFYKERFGVTSSVIPPMIDRDEYSVQREGRGSVVFIGLSAEKGLDTAIEVARLCPHIPFSFVESWVLSNEARATLKERLSNLSNIRYVRRQPDMRTVYSGARILLAPSRWKEGWGRVASEAHINGIPVIASRIGGLSEAVGPGGILIEPDASPSIWADALRKLWADDAAYESLAERALQYAKRPEFTEDALIARLTTELHAAIGNSVDGTQSRAVIPGTAQSLFEGDRQA